MKTFRNTFFILLVILIATGCKGKMTGKSKDKADSDTISVADTGYTGIKKYYSGNTLIKEVTFKNSIRHGLTKSYYQGGQLYQTFWYENGLRQDSAIWYYLEGHIFRITPYVNDTIHGTQKQYYRNGKLRAKINFVKGFRTPEFEEYTQTGKLVTEYPEIAYNIADNYKTSGRVKINLELSDKSTKVQFHKGEFINGVFDTTKCTKLKTVNGKANLDLLKTGQPQSGNMGVIAEIVTPFGNKYLAHKSIILPYSDLK